MQGIVQAVYAGTMPRESAIEMLVTSYPVDRTQAEAIIGEGKVDEPDGVTPPPSAGDGSDGNADTPPSSDSPAPMDGDIDDAPADDEDMPEQTEVDADNAEYIAGLSEDKRSAVIKLFADTENDALKKVNFKAQESAHVRNTTSMSEDMAQPLAVGRADIYKQVTKLFGNKSGANLDPLKVEKVVLPKGVLKKLRQASRNGLGTAMTTEVKLAQAEIPPSKRKREFSDKHNYADLMDTAKFLQLQSFSITGNISDDVNKKVQQILSNSIAYDWTLRDTIAKLGDDAGLAAVLPEFEVVTVNGAEVIRYVNVPARIETIARTSTTTAFNQARQSYFTSEVFAGYVQAFEYNAIMDDSVSEICEYLNGKIQRNWSTYLPPNHFNCRSLIVPVTVSDGWDGNEDNISANQQPNQGFG